MSVNLMEIHYLERPEGRLAYTLSGSGQLVIAVPGMGDLRSVYRDVSGPITDAGYRLAILDLRGHGDSDTTFTTHGDATTGSDILALIDELGEPAIVIGNSMSASAAAWAAAERPDALSGLVLIGPFLREPVTGPLARAAMRLLYRIMFARPWGAALWTAYYGSLNKVTRALWFDEHRRAIRNSLDSPDRLRSLRHLAMQLDHREVEQRLPEVTTPSLIIMGDHDPDFRSPGDELEWARSAIGATGTLVENAGHYPHAQRADIVAPAIVAFLATVRPTATNTESEGETDG